jgi:hypothetical protein
MPRACQKTSKMTRKKKSQKARHSNLEIARAALSKRVKDFQNTRGDGEAQGVQIIIYFR